MYVACGIVEKTSWYQIQNIFNFAVALFYERYLYYRNVLLFSPTLESTETKIMEKKIGVESIYLNRGGKLL